MTQLSAPDLLDPVTLSMARDFNRIINGSMEVAQRGSTSLTAGAGAYTLDRWRVADSDVSCSGTVATSVTSKNFYLGDVALSEQAVTGGNRRPRQVEALLCDRYFQRNVPMGGRGFSTGAGQAAGSTYTLRTTMRAAPTITPVVGVQSNVDTLSYHAQSAAGGCVTIPSAASGDFYWFGSVTADAEL